MGDDNKMTSGGNGDAAAEEIADRREENAQLYERPKATASDKQVACILGLIKGGYLDRDDFKNSREYKRKRTMSVNRADELIKLGLQRQRDYREWRRMGPE